MGYSLGVDVGTTFTAAAVWRDERVEVVGLEPHRVTVPTVIYADGDEVHFGAGAAARASAQPASVASEFKRRMGDSVPVFLSGSPYSADRLIALFVEWVVNSVASQFGEPPDAVVVTHPANWTNFQLHLLTNALSQVGIGEVEMLSEPQAAAYDFASAARLDPGDLVLVYDLGGGTFDVALLRREETGFSDVGEAAGAERLGGIDFDDAIFQFVVGHVPPGLIDEARTSDAGRLSLAQLRSRCVEAKEALSSEVAVDVPAVLPGWTSTVRVTRQEFEQMIRPMLRQTIDLSRQVLERAGLRPDELSAILLIGGSSRVPLVVEQVQTELGAPVRVDAHPKLVVARGAARWAGRRPARGRGAPAPVGTQAPSRRRVLQMIAAVAGLVVVAIGVAVFTFAGGDDDTATSLPSGGSTTVSSSGTTSVPSDATTAPPTVVPQIDASVMLGAVLEPLNADKPNEPRVPVKQILLDNVYETLLSYDAESDQFLPRLAQLPEVSDDGLTYKFSLRDGVTFHDGDALDAADVVWSLKQAYTTSTTGLLDTMASTQPVDELTVEITLSQRDNGLLFILSGDDVPILEENATDISDPINGTGPFVPVELNVPSSVSLGRYEDYWGEQPAVAEVTFRYFADGAAAETALTSGEIDILTGVNSDAVANLADGDEFVVNLGPTNGEFTLGMNNIRPPLDKAEVRRAIRHAIDKDGYLGLLNGFGTIIGGPVPPTDPWFEDLTDVVPYDPDAARELLASAGLAQGLSLTLVWPDFYPIEQADYVANQLAAVGITVQIVPVDLAGWNHQMFTDRTWDLTAILHAEARDISRYGFSGNYWGYDNPEVQQLMSDAKAAATPEEANQLLAQAARAISQDSPVDWLYLAANIAVSKPNVTGFPRNDSTSPLDASGIIVGQP